MDILEKQARPGDPAQVFIVAQKFTVGGEHSRLRMPTIHAGPEKTMFLAQIKVS